MDRNEAIELLKNMHWSITTKMNREVSSSLALNMAIEALEQPEIIRCRDCDWWTKQPDSAQGRCALLGMYPTGGWYCANAKRRGEADNEVGS